MWSSVKSVVRVRGKDVGQKGRVLVVVCDHRAQVLQTQHYCPPGTCCSRETKEMDNENKPGDPHEELLIYIRQTEPAYFISQKHCTLYSYIFFLTRSKEKKSALYFKKQNMSKKHLFKWSEKVFLSGGPCWGQEHLQTWQPNTELCTHNKAVNLFINICPPAKRLTV